MSFLRENGQQIIERPELLEPRFSDIIPIRDFADITDGPEGTDKYLRLVNLKQLIYPYKAETVELHNKSNIVIDLREGSYIVYKASLVDAGELLVIPTLDKFSEARLILTVNAHPFTIPASYVRLEEPLVITRNVLITIFCFNGDVFVEHNVVDLTLDAINASLAQVQAVVDGIYDDAQNISGLLGVTALGNRVTALEAYSTYVAPKITYFRLNGSSTVTIETGGSVVNPVFTWALSGAAPYILNISGFGNVSVLDTTVVDEGTFTQDKSWTLTALDRDPIGNLVQATSTATLEFKDKLYWGTSSKTSLSNVDVLGFSSKFDNGLKQTFTYNATGGKYIYYVYPERYGALNKVVVGGLNFSDYTEIAMPVINSFGVTTYYRSVRFNSLQNGANIEVVWS